MIIRKVERALKEMQQSKDIFDKIMRLPALNVFEPFYAKHKEILLYLFFGGAAFFFEHCPIYPFLWNVGNR